MTTYFCRKCWAEVDPKDANCRRCGASLTEGDGEDFVADLIAALRHPAPHNRRHAAWILGELRAQAALPALTAATGTKSDPDLLEGVAEALGKIGGDEAVEGLQRLLRGSYLSVRAKAVEALGRIEGQRATDALHEALNDPNGVVRNLAAEALRQRGEGSRAAEGQTGLANGEGGDE